MTHVVLGIMLSFMYFSMKILREKSLQVKESDSSELSSPLPVPWDSHGLGIRMDWI